MIIPGAVFDALHHLLGISKSIGNTTFQFNTFQETPFGQRFVDQDRSFPYFTFCTADRGNVEPFKWNFTAGDNFISRSQGCFHNTTGGSEDHGGTCGRSHETVAMFFRQRFEIESCLADHDRQFTGCKNIIHIVVPAGTHFLAVCLKFLGCAGHDGDGDDVLRVQVPFLRIIGLGKGAKHLLR